MRCLIWRWSLRFSCYLLVALLLSACAAGRADFRAGEKYALAEDYEKAVDHYTAALKDAPENREYRMKWVQARTKSARSHSLRGDSYMKQANYAAAVDEYQKAVDLDGSLFVVVDALENAKKYLQATKHVAEADRLLQARRQLPAKEAVRQALLLVPDYQPALQLKAQIDRNKYTIIDGVELEVTSDQPINLNFRDAKLPDVFDILSKLSGINFILDEDVRGSNTTLFLEQATFAQALELLLQMNKLDKKILNSKTIILFPKTRDKQKQFEDQIIQTFYLSSIDAKKAVNLLRTMLQVRKIYVHEELNAIIIRDKPEVVRLAQKIIEANDRGDAEVVFDLELIEVLHTEGLNFGPRLGAYNINVGVDAEALNTVAQPTVTSKIGSVVVDSLDGLQFLYGLPSASFDLMKESGGTEVLANPKIRVKNKEKAKVHIGSREPVITVTKNGDDFTDSVQYVDVGVKLDVEPIIQLDNTVVTKLGLEVSNVSGRSTTTSGTSVLTISTTNATTALTLKDGERTIIGGLLRDSKSKNKKTVPILGDIPLLGSLFSSHDNSKSKSEILLSITPHIVKLVNLPETNLSSIWSGGEDDMKVGRNFGTFADDYVAEQQGLLPKVDYQPLTDPAPQPVEKAPAGSAPEQPSGPEPVAVKPPALDAPAPVVPVELATDSPAIDEGQLQELETGEVTDETEAVEPQELVAEVQIPQPQQPVEIVKPKVYAQGPQLVKVGENFSVTFFVDEVVDLFSAPLYVQYDTQLFEFINAEEGGFLKQGPSPTVFTHTALNGSGRIIVGLKQGAGGKGLSGGGDLFVMNFKAITAGQGDVSPTRTNFRNPGGERLRVDTTGLTIEVGE
ncbi:MAG TPA: secretin N-terminal domain-containing protein [Malonomonas sp.]